MEELAGKVAIVTGGATLIGEAVVRVLAQAGVRVVIADISEDGAAVADRVGERARFIPTDVTDDRQIEQCVASTVKSYRFETLQAR
jgi:NAD(P)-dependent dehydrogenase (short-subunit alcohol dehydrogenase family)